MINSLFLIAAFLVFILARYLLGGYFHRRHDPTDDELLCALALRRDCSVYDIFKDAGNDWNFTDIRIDRDFDIYLKTNDIPLYVRQLLRSLPASRHAPSRQQPNPPFA